jgi:hypothetical protein
MPHFQIVNVNYALAKNIFKPVIVCDISPGIAVQVINVDGLAAHELHNSLRALTAWDMSNAISQKQIEKAAK